jgi:hypothetical protein
VTSAPPQPATHSPKQRSGHEPAWVWRASLVLLAAALLCFILRPTQADNDLWGHLRFGLDILQSHSIPRVDPYSYTQANGPWIDHEWLSELLFALAWKAGGATGLVVLKIAVGLLTGSLCYWHLVRAGVSSARAALVLLALILLLPPFFMIRPLAFTIPAFAFTLIVVYKCEHGGHATALWSLAPVYALWANLHGGLLAGLAILGIWAAARLILDRQWLRVGLPVAAAFAAVCLNPYGWRLPAFLVRTATSPRAEIIEWEPLRITSPYGLIYVVVLAISITGLILSRMEKRPLLLVLFAITSLLPFAATRHVALAAVGAVVLAGPHVGDMWKRVLENAGSASQKSMNPSARAALLPIFCFAALAVGAARLPLNISVSDQYPVQATFFLAANGFQGNLIHGFDWGEYLLWHLGPRVKVMVDGRRETLYSSEVYQRFLHFQSGTGDWDSLVRQYKPDVALLQNDSLSANLFCLRPDWSQIYKDDVAIIFVRRGTPSADRLAKAPAAHWSTKTAFYFP